MNTATSPTQGERPTWQIIQAVDLIYEVIEDQAFLLAIACQASNNISLMDEDLKVLLRTYLDRDPRGKLSKAIALADLAIKKLS